MAQAAGTRAAEIFGSNDSAREILARLALLRKYMPEHPWPEFGPAELGHLLSTITRGKRSIEELKHAPLASLLENHLQYPLDRLLDRHAPVTLPVPSGSQISVEYTRGERPIMSVRLQELFGLLDTPRVAGSRVAIVLHLLALNYRPVQITDDLRSFWANAYFQVRKDLRVRYPKHKWPEDPLTATPEAKGRKRVHS